MTKKMTKSRKNKMIDGVCGGIAEYFNIDATIVRLICIAVCFLKGAGILIYVVAAIVMPYGEDFGYDENDDVENLKSANVDEQSADGKSESAKKSSGKSKSAGKKEAPHTDEEFEKFFKK